MEVAGGERESGRVRGSRGSRWGLAERKMKEQALSLHLARGSWEERAGRESGVQA